MGPQETMSILRVSGLPSTKWEHSLFSLWGGVEEEGERVLRSLL